MKLKSTAFKTSAALNSNFIITDLSGTVFNITAARTNVRHIQFDFPESNSNSSHQVSLNGPFIVDLITGRTNPAIKTVEVIPGIYKRVDVRLDDTKLEDGLISSEDELLDNTFILKGSFEYDGRADRKFTIILKFNEDVRFEQPNGITVKENNLTNMILHLKVDEWLSNIDITECLANGDIRLDENGDLTISDNTNSGSCEDFENKLKTNIKNNYDFN